MIDTHAEQTVDEDVREEERLPGVILGRRLREALAAQGVDLQATGGTGVDDEGRFAPLVLEHACDITPVATGWLWPWRIPHRRLTILAGESREVAAQVAFDIAARVSRGLCWPDQPAEAENALSDGGEPSPAQPADTAAHAARKPQIVPAVGNVVVISANGDMAETAVPGLARARADMERTYCLAGVFQPGRSPGSGWTRDFRLPEDFRSLRRALREMAPVRLLVIDPIEALLHSSAIGWGPRIAEAVVEALNDIVRDCDVAIVGVAALRREGGRGGMGVAIRHPALATGAPAAWGIARAPGSSGTHLMVPIKMNIGSPGPPLEFTTGEGGIEWSATPAIVAGEDSAAATREGLAVAAGMTWLRNLFAPGARPALEIEELAREAGVSRTLLRRAKAEIGVQTDKVGCRGKSYWSLPDSDETEEGEKVRAFEVDPAPLNDSRGILKGAGGDEAPRL